jgi:hypothetical protein
MTDQNEELFDHQVAAWTAGQLRQALAGVPDDFPVTVVTAEEPGSALAGDEQVIISAGPWSNTGADSADEMRSKIANGELQPDHFEIDLEFPSGQYYRRVR